MARNLRLHNTATRNDDPFDPRDRAQVTMYTCGPTVYAPQHLGNMRSQVFADLVRRVVESAGYPVLHVINITDVGHLTDDGSHGDDKMEVAARARGQSALEVARFFEQQWSEDRTALNCGDPDVLCRASEHIDEQIEIVQELERRGHTYVIGDGVYFDTSTFDRYPDFARLNIDDMAEHGRIDHVDGKRSDADFALWKLSGEGEQRLQEWDSPWGVGFPGWHIECTAMASKYLGTDIDIHTGGIDHIPVHHTNEIAQAECAFGVSPWVRFWMHNEFLNLEKSKMSKSTGDELTVASVVERGMDPVAFRYFLLTAHYRSAQRFSWDTLESNAVALERLRRASAPAIASGTDAELSEAGQQALGHFWEAIDADLNTADALATAWQVARDQTFSEQERGTLLATFDAVLGLDLDRDPDALADDADVDVAAIEAAIEARQLARSEGRYEDADQIRDDLAAQGIELRDGADGVAWKTV